ncbi:GSCFA domain-containing protein [Microbulbifer sp. EKSA008]|uniref:GSCFA domain-containing protein n=1 Tax=unclassified Microbulbifer TaxID=2619833 RepID=UPI00404226CF
MPIQILSDKEAVNIKKNNRAGHWPNRSADNRYEPIARPDFMAGFQFRPGSCVFSVGSCFARNVETKLIELGFHIPSSEIFELPEFEDPKLDSITNFGVASIYNEFKWALDENSGMPEECIVEVNEGKYCDLNVLSSIRPASLETVKTRREAITRFYKSVQKAETIIITLGLSEVWFDKKTNLYLNTVPLQKVIELWPGRFELHVLNYNEVYDHLDKTIQLLKANAKVQQNILITISPVPMSLTYRNQDISISNSYSKSVLRAAAEALVYSNSNVFYYPSYESILLTDRSIAWMDDQVHVRDELVRIQVSRLIDKYCQPVGDLSRESVLEQLRTPSTPMSAKEALFSKYRSMYKEFPDFALQFARYLNKTGNYEEADKALSVVKTDANTAAIKAQALRGLRQFEKAREILEPFIEPKLRNHSIWKELISIHIDQGNLENAMAVIEQWAQVSRGISFTAYKLSAKLIEPLNQEIARAYLEKALEVRPGDEVTMQLLKKMLTSLESGKRQEDSQNPRLTTTP